MSEFGFPWEQDAQRASKSKKYAKKLLGVRNSKRHRRTPKGKRQFYPGWYEEYLKSDHWKDFKVRYAASKQPQKCAACGNSDYELHHKTYARIWHETFSDVVPLCRGHHAKVHKLEKQGLSLEEATKKVITGV